LNALDMTPATILVAEDQDDLREMLAYTLRLAGHDVVSAPDGEAAMVQAELSHPDLIILDMHMPFLDGAQVCERLKSQDEFQGTPILIISAQGSAEEVQAGLQAGAHEYLRKPFEINLLMERVEALLTEG
jgi:DNA-binding response OmpR family regulator